MIDPQVWQGYHRPDPSAPWTWIAAGPTYGEAHSLAMLRARGKGELTVLFGRALPDNHGRPVPTRGALR